MKKHKFELIVPDNVDVCQIVSSFFHGSDNFIFQERADGEAVKLGFEMVEQSGQEDFVTLIYSKKEGIKL